MTMISNPINEKYGYWEVGVIKFDRKFDALLYATKNNGEVFFKYHNQVWKDFDRNLIGKIPLSVLYKERAQQLRDKYDYLILNYSGGADSHNILRTFIDNNIKLDEVFVKWPTKMIGSTMYTPNTVDTSARNFWSEWNYAIDPILKWIANNKPEIKIVIEDYVGDPDKIDIEALLLANPSHIRSAILQTHIVSSSTLIKIDNGISVGNIFGVDKPLLILENGEISMFFSDHAISSVPTGSPELNAELFYWTPDYPILAFEMAYQTSAYYKAHPEARKNIMLKQTTNRPASFQYQYNIAIDMCYCNTWDYRFQANKPLSPTRSDKWFWFFDNKEFDKPFAVYRDQIYLRLEQLIDKFKWDNATYKVVFTQKIPVTRVDD